MAKSLNEFQQAKEALYKHGVIAFPTETVMGLGVLYNDRIAYDKLNKIKRRPEDKPYTLMVKDVNDISEYALIDDRTQRVIDAFMPGSITILVPVKGDAVPEYVTHGTSIIGIRVPENKEALEVLKEAKLPLLVPSANRSGEKPALSDKEVKEIFSDEVDYVVSGQAKLAKPSTIVSLVNGQVKVVREGPISEEKILKIYNK